MKSVEIERIAKDLIDRENKTDWRFEIGIPEKRNGSVWSVFVRWISPDGDLLDGPGIIHVDETNGEAWFEETC